MVGNVGTTTGVTAPAQKKLTLSLYHKIISTEEFHHGEWRDNAACATLPRKHPERYSVEDWFPTTSPPTVSIKVRDVCKACPVRLECLSFAIMLVPEEGIWAGHTSFKIRKMARKMEGKT